MSLTLDRLSQEDPMALIASCHRSLLRLLICGQPLPRHWIDHPYGEEEITLLEEELLPAIERFLHRIEEIDAELEVSERAEL